LTPGRERLPRTVGDCMVDSRKGQVDQELRGANERSRGRDPCGKSRGLVVCCSRGAKSPPPCQSQMQNDLINACKSRPINLVSATKARSTAVSLASSVEMPPLGGASLRYDSPVFPQPPSPSSTFLLGAPVSGNRHGPLQMRTQLCFRLI
jgi:hypothetical protein